MTRMVRGLVGLVGRRPLWVSLLSLLLVLGGLALGRWLWTEYHFRAAQQALQQERFAEARSHVQACLNEWGGSRALLLAARIERAAGNFPAAENYLRTHGQRYRMNEDVQLEWLLLRARRGELDDVESALFQAVQNGHRETPLILQTLARSTLDQQLFDRALVYLNLWLEKVPEDVRARSWRGWVWERSENFDAAAEDYRQVLNREPGRHAARLSLASLLLRSSTPLQSLEHLEQLQRALPDSPVVLTDLARCRLLQGKREEAGRLLDRALALAPQDAQALLWRGTLELERGHRDAAETFLRRALKEDPVLLEARLRLIACLRSQPGREAETEAERRHHEELERDVKRLAQLLRVEMPRSAPNDPEVPAEIGKLFLRLGQTDAGVRWLKGVALKRDGTHAFSHALLARYYEHRDERQAEYHRRRAGTSMTSSASGEKSER